jgi:hypothetical protein
MKIPVAAIRSARLAIVLKTKSPATMDVSSARKGCGHARVIGFDYLMMVMTAKSAARAKAKDKRDDFRRK